MKIKLLERLVKVITGADKIEYHPWSSPVIKLFDVDPKDVKKVGWDEGIDFDWGADMVPNTWNLPHSPKSMAVITLEVWFDEDPQVTIEELKKKVAELESKR